MLRRKISDRLISFLLIIILLSGNILSCAVRQDGEYADGAFEPSPYNSISGDNSAVFTVFLEDEFTVFLENKYFVFLEDEFSDKYIAELTVLLEDKFHNEVNEIFVSYMDPDDYDRLSLIMDPERQLDIKNIITNLAIGGAIIIVCIAIPALVPGLAPQVVTLLLSVPVKALIGAAVTAAVSGVISYVKNNGDLTEVFYDTVEGASEGFKFGAIFAAGEAAFTAVRLAVNAARIKRLTASNARRVIEQSRIQINALSNSEREALRALSGNEYYERINFVKRTGRCSLSPVESMIDRNASSALSKASLADDVVVWRGIRMSDDFEALIGHNLRDIYTNRVSIEALKRLEGRRIIERGYLHTSLEMGKALNFGDDLVMEIYLPQKSNFLHLGHGNSVFPENEIMGAAGQVLRFGKLRVENGIPVIEAFVETALPSLAVPAAGAAVLYR